MARRALHLLLALLLALPTVCAAASSGEFTAAGSLRLPAGATHDLLARGAYLPARDGEGFLSFTLQAEVLRVHRFERFYVEARTGVVSPSNQVGSNDSTYTLTNATVTMIAGDNRGWVGLYFPPEGHPVAVASTGPSVVNASARTRLGEGFATNADPDDPSPDVQGYDWASDDPLVVTETFGLLRQEGRGMLKVKGPDLRFDADENTTVFRSGSERDGAGGSLPVGVGNRTERWLFLEYERGTLTIGTDQPFQVASEESVVDWSGAASFTPVQGELRSAGDVYAATGEPARVSGDLTAVLSPLPSEGQALLHLALSGDLASTTLPRAAGRATTPFAFRPPGWTWVAGLLASLALAALVATVLIAARRGGAGDVSPEDRVSLAHLAASREQYRDALAHVRAARAGSPHSARLLMEEASYLGALGQVEEALALYEEAARLSPDADAEFQAGLLLLQHGEPARAEDLLVRALRRSPILVLEVVYDTAGLFDLVRGRPSFDDAVEAARREVEGA